MICFFVVMALTCFLQLRFWWVFNCPMASNVIMVIQKSIEYLGVGLFVIPLIIYSLRVEYYQWPHSNSKRAQWYHFMRFFSLFQIYLNNLCHSCLSNRINDLLMYILCYYWGHLCWPGLTKRFEANYTLTTDPPNSNALSSFIIILSNIF